MRPFGWMIFIDARTDQARACQDQELCDGEASLIPIAGHLTDDRVRAEVDRLVPNVRSRLLTTRLDNDDALAPSYVERVSRAAEGWDGFINPLSGLACTSSGYVLRRWDPSCAFLTFVEERQPGQLPLTVLSVRHDLADTLGPVKQLPGIPMWMQFIHGKNISNEARGFRYPRNRAASQFAVALPSAPDTAEIMWSVRAGLTEVYKTSHWLFRRLRRGVQRTRRQPG